MEEKLRVPQMRRQVSLCLACSSSLPPKVTDIFLTPCCARPICPTCLLSNPRLGRYNPCLSCLGGIDVIRASSSHSADPHVQNMNLDGAVRDADTFILGDDDGDDDLDAPDFIEDSALSIADPPPSYTSTPSGSGSRLSAPLEQHTTKNNSIDTPPSYNIKPSDTLRGIALRLGINERELCRLNNLPASTLSTTPHLLHTRTSLKLPSFAFPQSAPSRDLENEGRRVRERAEKHLQTLTKEVDWHVARAYVALADDSQEEVAHAIKSKEMELSTDQSNLLARAVNQYLDDQEWEEVESKVARHATSSYFWKRG